MSDEEIQLAATRLPTHAFGYTFTHIPQHARADVESLEREGVDIRVYTVEP